MVTQKDDLELPHPLNRVMGGWVCLVEDTRRLSKLIAALPDQCECRAHSTPCACCVDRATILRGVPDLRRAARRVNAAARRGGGRHLALPARSVGNRRSIQRPPSAR